MCRCFMKADSNPVKSRTVLLSIRTCNGESDTEVGTNKTKERARDSLWTHLNCLPIQSASSLHSQGVCLSVNILYILQHISRGNWSDWSYSYFLCLYLPKHLSFTANIQLDTWLTAVQLQICLFLKSQTIQHKLLVVPNSETTIWRCCLS